jgi:hypothetical protein
MNSSSPEALWGRRFVDINDHWAVQCGSGRHGKKKIGTAHPPSDCYNKRLRDHDPIICLYPVDESKVPIPVFPPIDWLLLYGTILFPLFLAPFLTPYCTTLHYLFQLRPISVGDAAPYGC